jgi:foldase protein PrsA
MVGSEKITLPEYKFYLSGIKNQMEASNKVNTSDKNAVKNFWEAKTGDSTNAANAITQSLESMKDLKILLSKAKEEMIQLNNDDLTKIKSDLEGIVQQEGGTDKAKAQEAISKKYGISYAEFESIYKSYYLAYNKYGAEAMKKIDLTEKEIKDYYDKNAASYDNVTVKHILILTNDSKTGQALTGAKLDEKKKLAEDILSKAKSGTDFESLVKQYSEDPGSKDKGGEYTFGKGKMVKEFEDWSFSAKEGDMGIVQTSYGYHVMKFIKKEVSTFEKQKDTIKSKLLADAFKKKMEEWKKDPKYDIKRNQKVIDSVKIYQ